MLGRNGIISAYNVGSQSITEGAEAGIQGGNLIGSPACYSTQHYLWPRNVFHNQRSTAGTEDEACWKVHKPSFYLYSPVLPSKEGTTHSALGLLTSINKQGNPSHPPNQSDPQLKFSSQVTPAVSSWQLKLGNFFLTSFNKTKQNKTVSFLIIHTCRLATCKAGLH